MKVTKVLLHKQQHTMTRPEYNLWIAETRKVDGDWTLDSIHCTKEDFLAYKKIDRTDGYFLMINKGHVHLGVYRGAIPHIGEAIFHNQGAWNLNGRDNREILLSNVIKGVCGEWIHGHLFSQLHPRGEAVAV